MTFTVDGTETPVGKAFADAFESYVLITVTPDTEVGSYVEALSASDVEYLQFMVLPQNLNRELDLVAEPHNIYCRDNESDCTIIAPGDNLSAGKERNPGRDAGDDTVFGHRHLHHRGQFHFYKPLVGNKSGATGRYRRKVFGKGLFPFLFRYLYIVPGILYPHVVFKRQLQALFEGVGPLGSGREGCHAGEQEKSVFD